MSRFEIQVTINTNTNWGKYENDHTVTFERNKFIERIQGILKCNTHYGVTDIELIEKTALYAVIKFSFNDDSGYFPGIIAEHHAIPEDPDDGCSVDNYEVHIKCNNEADMLKVGHFTHYQLAGRQEYVDSKIFLHMDEDKFEVILIINGDVNNRPIIVPIADDFVIKASELY